MWRLDAAWSKLQTDPKMSKRLKEMNLDPAGLERTDRKEVIQVVSGSEAGFTGLETVALNVAAGIAVKIFEAVILPAITKGLNREDVKIHGKVEGEAASDASNKP